MCIRDSIKKDCPNKEKASRLFSNRVNNVDELPDDEGEVEEGEESGEKAKNTTAETKSQSNNDEDTLTIASIVKEINGKNYNQNDAWNDEFPKEDENKKRKKDASLNSSSSSTDSPNITKKTKEGDQNDSLEESRDEI